MTNELVPLHAERENDNRPLREKVFDRYSHSELGDELRGSARFHKFIPEGMSDQEWINIIGLDGDNLYHMRVTHDLVNDFIVESEINSKGDDEVFTEDEKDLLLFTALVHDMAEVVVGDIPRPDKTEDDDKEELEILSGILYHFIGEDLDEESKINLIGDVIAILDDKESKLGNAFSASEFVGYSRTAFNAWSIRESMLEEDDENELTENLAWLSQDVILGDLYTLIKAAKYHPYAKLHLKRNQKLISDIIANAIPSERHDLEYIENCAATWGDYKESLNN